MKLILISTIVILTNLTYSQDLILQGKVISDFSEKKEKKVYYREEGGSFSSKKSILLTSDQKYSLKISLKKIQDEKIERLYFTLDSTIDISDRYACFYKINVAEIVKSPIFKNQKSIKLESDLFLHCYQTVGYEATDDHKERFVGDYRMKVNDTIHTLTLYNGQYRVSGAIDKLTKNFMDREKGSWDYNPDKKTLTISVGRLENELFGTGVKTWRQYVFSVVEGDSTSFMNIEGVKLSKLQTIYSEPTTEEEIRFDLDEDPYFPGGMSVLLQFLNKNLRYPEIALEEGLEGKCLISFVVSSQGNLSDFKVVRGVSGCPECDREAIRIARLMPNWIPGKIKGVNVRSRYVIPIRFAVSP